MVGPASAQHQAQEAAVADKPGTSDLDDSAPCDAAEVATDPSGDATP